MEEQILMEQEQEYLKKIEEKLDQRIGEMKEELKDTVKDVESMHDYFWENYTEMDEYGYENFDNQQALLQQVNHTRALEEMKYRYIRMKDSPYFGRVDFQYEGDSFSEEHYIGIANFTVSEGAVPLIFDWRAPVSSLFYDYDKGEASYEAPGGRISGEITSKRQYKIRRGKIVYALESDMKVDDDILREELSAHGDIYLKNIVRTIQKEQNEIIRNTKDRILVVQGAAGSGKTSVALHRIAYLLYHDRKYLKSSDVLILSPNRVFSSYISRILPELGEENIREMSFDEFAWKELRGIVSDCEDRYDQIERIMKANRKKKVREDLTEYKSSRKYLEEIDGFLLMQEDDLVEMQDLHYKKIDRTAKELTELFYFKFTDIPMFARMQAVMDYVIDEAETLQDRDFSDDEKAAIGEKFDRMYQTKDIYRIYRKFLKEQGLPDLLDAPAGGRFLFYEDVYPLLYMKYSLEGVGSMRRVRHLVVDEMQDYSYVQYRILEKLFSCRMTIVGDRYQTMGAKVHDVMKFLPSIFGKNIRMLSVNRSYRCTMEIGRYAGEILKKSLCRAGMKEEEITLPENLGRHGKEPEEIPVKDREEAADRILSRLRLSENDPFETAVVICMNAKTAENLYEKIKVRLEQEGYDTEKRLTLLHKDSERFCFGLAVTTFYMAKGLEFDQVFFAAAGEEDNPFYDQAAYIAATRALHELYFLKRTSS